MIFLMIKREDSTQLGKSGKYLNFLIAAPRVKDPRDTEAEVAPTMTEVRFSRSENSCIIWCGKNQTRR